MKYIYSDKLECDMPNLASSLMTAADKYNIPRLKSLCEESICNNIEVSNAADILVLAHMYEASNLKVMAIDFIMNNLDKVSETPGWTNITTGKILTASNVVVVVLGNTFFSLWTIILNNGFMDNWVF